MGTKNRLILTAALAAAIGVIFRRAVLAALTGGTLTLNNTSTNSGGGNMGGGGFAMNFAMGGAAAAMSGGGFSLQPGAIGAAKVATANLDQAHSFPTVFKPSLGHDRIIFDQLTSQVTITVYNLGGEKVKILTKSDPLSDQMVWMPVANEGGLPLASGIYLFTVSSPGHAVKKGKLMIIK